MASANIRRKNVQMSDAFILSLVISFSGGLQDAYTYMVRGHVFANAQTGNVVLMSTGLMSGDAESAFKYLLPILFFAIGVFIAENVGYRFRNGRRLHWRQGILLLEILIMFIAGLMPAGMNTAANVLISMACAMQVQSFRKVHGNSYASTMCIGNLRSGTAALSAFIRDRDRQELKRVKYYFGVIAIFALGAGTGSLLSGIFHERTIWLSCVILLAGVLLMAVRPEDNEIYINRNDNEMKSINERK